MHIKPPAVAGLFYPESESALRRAVRGYMANATAGLAVRPHALIAPHASYAYSGPIAANAYATLRPWADQIDRVAVLAPSHRVAFRGVAISNADAFQTPLGTIRVDSDINAVLATLPGVEPFDAAFAHEHALEVQLPFLQTVLTEFTLVPLVVGDADDTLVATVVDTLARRDLLLIISSDLSHYHDYPSCQRRDRATTAEIEGLHADAIGPDDACGAHPMRGLLTIAGRRGWRVQTLDLRNSGDTAGDTARVVGYGAYAFV